MGILTHQVTQLNEVILSYRFGQNANVNWPTALRRLFLASDGTPELTA
jgi:hypothetical protein